MSHSTERGHSHKPRLPAYSFTSGDVATMEVPLWYCIPNILKKLSVLLLHYIQSSWQLNTWHFQENFRFFNYANWGFM